MIENLKDLLNTEEGKADFKKFIDKWNGRDELTLNRYRRFEKWLENNDFDILMYRLVQEHDDNYIDKCYRKGHMPNANRKLGFVIGYVVNNLSPIRVIELDNDFPNRIWQFRGYYFQHIYGQGTITRIYNKDNNKLLLQL